MNKNETDKFNLMFEQLNEQLTDIKKLLTNQDSQEHQKTVAIDLNPLKDIAIQTIEQYEKYSKALANGITALGKQQCQILSKAEDTHAEFLSLKAQKGINEEKKCLKIDIKSLKTLSIFMSFGLSFLLSILLNINLIRQNGRMKDNDLKYQIIKENNGINKSELAELELLFYPKRNKKTIKQLKNSLSK